MNIQTKLFAGFAIVVVISAAMGLNAVKSIHDMSNLTNRLYEHPLMSSNFARSAQANYINMNVSLSLALSSLDASKLDDHIAAAEEFQDEDMDRSRQVSNLVLPADGGHLDVMFAVGELGHGGGHGGNRPGDAPAQSERGQQANHDSHENGHNLDIKSEIVRLISRLNKGITLQGSSFNEEVEFFLSKSSECVFL